MKLIKINPAIRARLMSANAKSGNVQLIPCCYEGMDGEYVEFDAIDKDPELFAGQIMALGLIPPKSVFDVERYTPDGSPTATLREKL